MKKPTAISLFSGAMGLDLGVESAGFDIRVCVEMDRWASETIRRADHKAYEWLASSHGRRRQQDPVFEVQELN